MDALDSRELQLVIDELATWLRGMEADDLLTLTRKPGRLVIKAPSGAAVTLQRVGGRIDMSRVLLGTVFSLRIARYDGQWYIEDRLGGRQELEEEAFYGELRELLEPPGP